MNTYEIKKSTLFLIFKDCINEYNNDNNNSLFCKIWIDKIERDNIRKNRERPYVEEYLNERKKIILEYLAKTKHVIKSEQDIIKLFDKYLLENPIRSNEENDSTINSLSNEDIIRVSRAFLDSYNGEYAIIILYYPIQNDWKYVKEKLQNNKINIISEFLLDFSGNQIGFENCIHDIYDDYSSDSKSLIERKIQLLVKSRMIIDILVVVSEQNIFERLADLKLQLRDILTYTVDKNSFLNLHTPEDYFEADHLKHILVSANNIWYMKNRLINEKRDIFNGKLEKVLCEFEDECIDKRKYVIVSTGAMEAAGIWNCNDIDMINIDDIKKLKSADCMDCEYNKVNNALDKLSNIAIVTDDNNYFVYHGLKFANLNLIKERIISNIEKYSAKMKVSCINQFYMFTKYVDEKNILNIEIKKEFLRRKREQKRSLFRRCASKAKRVIKKLWEE